MRSTGAVEIDVGRRGAERAGHGHVQLLLAPVRGHCRLGERLDGREPRRFQRTTGTNIRAPARTATRRRVGRGA